MQLLKPSEFLRLIASDFHLAVGGMFFLFSNFDVFSAYFTKFGPGPTSFFVPDDVGKRKRVLAILAFHWSLRAGGNMSLKFGWIELNTTEGTRFSCVKLVLSKGRNT